VAAGANPQFDTAQFRLVYSSPLTPPSTYDYDLSRRERRLLKRREVPGGYDPARYRTERLTAIAADGAQIPISIVYRADRPAQPGPLLLYGYGAYGISIDPAFDSNRVSLLDRGVAWAIAHVRGGEELGRAWYEGGKLEHKPNSFTDFIACAERLIESGWTRPDRLVLRGGSAGGLLVGAVLNMRPELCHAAVLRVPFVDVANTMSDPTLPLTVTEYDEWGDVRDPAVFERVLRYSPYENVAARAYPHILATGGLNDPRVGFWEPAKWVARLRELKTNDSVLLLKTELGAGHAGPSGRYGRLEELAFEFAFVLDSLGLRDASP
jgi:oligopeptidase B